MSSDPIGVPGLPIVDYGLRATDYGLRISSSSEVLGSPGKSYIHYIERAKNPFS
jgi:hypothetical protein